MLVNVYTIADKYFRLLAAVDTVAVNIPLQSRSQHTLSYKKA